LGRGIGKGMERAREGYREQNEKDRKERKGRRGNVEWKLGGWI